MDNLKRADWEHGGQQRAVRSQRSTAGVRQHTGAQHKNRASAGLPGNSTRKNRSKGQNNRYPAAQTAAKRNGQQVHRRSGTASGGAGIARGQAAVSRPQRRNVNPNELRRQALRKAYRKRRKAEIRRNRILAVVFVIMALYLSFRAVAGILTFIETSREMQRGVMETVDSLEMAGQSILSESAPELSGIGPGDALSENRDDSPSESMESEVTGSSGSGEGEGDSTDPTKVLSNGRYVDTTKPMIAFTFDDGPNTSVDQALMNALEAVDGRGTFFIVGSRAQSYTDVVKDVHNRGHEVANHSWSHNTKMSKESASYIQNEFQKTDDLIQSLTGESPKVYRLPGGNISDTVRSVVQKPLIYWSIDTLDWKTRNADSVRSTVMGKVKDGDIVLMHALYQSTAEACASMIPELSAQGYQFVTVSELIAFHGAQAAGGNGKQYSNFPPQETAAPETTEAETSAAPETTAGETAPALSSDTVLVGPGAQL